MSHIKKYDSFVNEDHEATENGYLFNDDQEETGEISHEQEEVEEEGIQSDIEQAIMALKGAVDNFASFEETEQGDSAEHAAKEQEIITQMNVHIEALACLMNQLNGEEAREESEEEGEMHSEPVQGAVSQANQNVMNFQGFGSSMTANTGMHDEMD